MKKILQNNKQTKVFLEKLPLIYMVGRWAGYGVRSHYYAGKTSDKGIPYVYEYYDGNGRCDEWHLQLLTDTTTGWILCWTTSKTYAEAIAEAMNQQAGEDGRNK